MNLDCLQIAYHCWQCIQNPQFVLSTPIYSTTNFRGEKCLCVTFERTMKSYSIILMAVTRVKCEMINECVILLIILKSYSHLESKCVSKDTIPQFSYHFRSTVFKRYALFSHWATGSAWNAAAYTFDVNISVVTYCQAFCRISFKLLIAIKDHFQKKYSFILPNCIKYIPHVNMKYLLLSV